jgi:hypothetical protein
LSRNRKRLLTRALITLRPSRSRIFPLPLFGTQFGCLALESRHRSIAAVFVGHLKQAATDWNSLCPGSEAWPAVNAYRAHACRSQMYRRRIMGGANEQGFDNDFRAGPGLL